MALAAPGLLVPGWGATAGLYSRGLPAGWEALSLPSFRATGGDLGAYRLAVERELEARHARPVAVAGHSLGAALAVLAAAASPELVTRLILVAPAGLPYTKPVRGAARALASQIVRGRYPAAELARAGLHVAAAPRAALRLAHDVHDLDLGADLARVRAHAIPSTVVGCAQDELATPSHCRRLASLLGADYREVDARDGHIWPITEPELLRRELEDVTLVMPK
jgi:pimeloyl-ACP methyl ester carboxylesterase